MKYCISCNKEIKHRTKCGTCYSREYTKHNKAKVLSNKKKYRDSNKEKLNLYTKNKKKQNRELYSFYEAKRRARKLKATPTWANLELIKQFYLNCPKGYQVDHIIPLQGKNVSGLHIETNLQYLKTIDNRKKGNKYDY